MSSTPIHCGANPAFQSDSTRGRVTSPSLSLETAELGEGQTEFYLKGNAVRQFEAVSTLQSHSRQE